MNVCISIRKRCLRDYNEFDCIVEVRSNLEAEVLNSIFCFFFSKAEYGGISSIFDKTLELIRNTLFNRVFLIKSRSRLTTSRGLLVLDKVHSEEFVCKLAS